MSSDTLAIWKIAEQLGRVADALETGRLAPESDFDALPEVDEKDIRVDIYGQAVPGGEWGLRLTHMLTGFVVYLNSDDVSSKLQAKARALRILQMRLQLQEWGYQVTLKKGSD